MHHSTNIRLGLCCLVLDAPLGFRSTTHAYVTRIGEAAGRTHLDAIARHNADTLVEILRYCESLGIRAFRIASQLFPLATHPVSGYALEDLPSVGYIREALERARDLARNADIRLSFHPDQFIVLNSVRPEVVASSVGELEWQAEMAELLGADVICLHGGGMTGGVDAAAERLIAGIEMLSTRARSRLAIENDDRCFAPDALLPVSLATGVPFVLDAHHYRVVPGVLSLEEATDLAVASWGDREPYFHISSPKVPWGVGDPRPHADFIDPNDLPDYWLEIGLPLTIDIEAKAKERAVLRLREDLARGI